MRKPVRSLGLHLLLSAALIANSWLPALAVGRPATAATPFQQRALSDWQQSAPPTADSQRTSAQINLTATGFEPAVLTVAVGTEVVWVNNTNQAHFLQSGSPTALYLPLIRRNNATDQQVVQAVDPRNMQPIPTIDKFAGALSVGGTFAHTFSEPGAFFYYLTTNPQMRGQVIVEETLPAGATGLSGRLLDTNSSVQGQDIPVVGAVVSLLGTEYKTTSDANGRFSIIAYVAGRQVLDIDTRSAQVAPDGSPYAGFREKIELVAQKANTVARPFYLPRVARESLTQVDPSQTTTVNNGSLGVSMVVPPVTAKNDADNSDFSGQLSISEVPSALAPAALPDTLNPGLLITIQPVGVRFATAVPITFPNTDNLPPGSETDIWSLDPERGVFVVVATGRVSADGKRIETVSGGIRAADWHMAMPPLPAADGGYNNYENQQPACPINISSFTDASTGNLFVDHDLVAYQSLSQFRSLRLVYASLLADPRPIVINDMVIARRSAVPNTVSSRITVNGVASNEQFISTKGLNENVDEPIRQMTLIEASSLTTGIYSYQSTLTSNYTASSVSAETKDKLLVRNEANNAFGAGWGLEGVDRLYLQTNGDALLAEGNGGTRLFDKSQPGEFTAPASLPTGLLPQDVALGDFNKDGAPDVAVATIFGLNGYAYIHLGDGKGNFDAGTRYLINGRVVAMVTADMDGDNNLDLVTANETQGTISLLWGQGNGTFSAPNVYPIPLGASFIAGPAGITVGDFNRDSFLDVATANKNGQDIAVFLSTGVRSYGAATNYALAEQPDDIVAADFNQDGNLDLATANNTNIAILHGNASGNFGQPTKLGRTTYALSIASGDFNRDGAPDLATTGSTFLGLDTAVTVFLNDRHGGFFQPKAIAMGANLLPDDIATADLNSDGLLDLVTANETSNVSLLLGDGEGEFAKPTQLALRGSAIAVGLGDLNQDGQTDITLGTDPPGLEDTFTVLLNRSPGPLFISPAGDFTTLVKNDDGTFTRRWKDGTETRFNAQGLQTAVIDRNGNSTQYSYDANGLLTTLTDPVGKVTTLTYNNGRLNRITDPVGRNTAVEHDSAGNLVRITDPDNSVRQFAYDARHHLVSQTSKLGQVTTYEYNFAGRHIKSVLPDGSIRTLDPGQSAALIDPASGVGTQANPAPVIRPGNVLATYTDSAGMITKYSLERLGNANAITDPAGLITEYQRDADGNPTQTKLPSGAIYERTYDNRGNLLTLTDKTVNGTTQFTYDATFSQVTSITDPFNKSIAIAYDERGNATKITTPLGRVLQFGYDSRGLLTGLTDTLGTQSALSYDGQGNLTQLVQGGGANQRTTATTYTPAGYPQEITDATGRAFSFQYDDQGRLTNETLPGNRTITYQYNANSELTGVTPPGRPSHGFEYNALGLLTAYVPPTVAGSGTTRTTYEYNAAQALTKVNRPDGKSVVYSYDNAGRLTNLALARGSLQYEYAANTGQLSAIKAPENVNLAYSYAGELLTGVKWSGPISGSVTYQYDANYHVTKLAVNGSAINYQYDADSAITQAGDLKLAYNATTGLYTGSTLGNVTDQWQYNEFGEPTRYTASYSGAALFDTQYTRDTLGRIITLVETVNGATTTYNYTYDVAGRLSQVQRNGTTIATYTYDANGNRLSYVNASNTTVNGTYDDQDRLLQYGDTAYSYTANGELQGKTSNGKTVSYQYDELNNLTAVSLPDGTQISYVIDGENRQIGKKVNGVLQQVWLYQDSISPIAELDGNKQIISRFVYGERTTVPEYMVKGGVTYRFIYDHLGSVRLVVNSQTGAIVQYLEYDAFGQVMQDTAPSFQPFGFASGLYEAQTGMVRFGSRDYDAIVGRWTTKDSVRFDGGDTNLYAYVNNNPVNFNDSFGYAPGDKNFGLPKEFWKWYHRQVKRPGDPDLTKEEALEEYEEWKKQGKPGPEGSKEKSKSKEEKSDTQSQFQAPDPNGIWVIIGGTVIYVLWNSKGCAFGPGGCVVDWLTPVI